ncbi:DEKNAAC104254 [Brettanomyces naardenensis]|uniref:DEKNAAC104254 n=1 Tax=Brettanomyces naardenensis TaxID=13370 RepID=A0A448YPQ8_BRENA|nr:DEKNAAC104254 [Brettanomyces naardenensis]
MIFIQTILLYYALKFRPPEAESLEVYDGHWSSVRDRFFEVNTNLLKDEMQECVGEKFPGIDKSLISGISLVIFRNWQRNSMLFGLFLLKLVSEFLRLFDAHYVRPFHFWQWHNAMKYWYFILALVLSTSVLQSIFIGNEHYALMLGSSSFLIESSLPLPQILLFQRVKTVQNFKTILLLSWLAGDLTKISYLLYGTDNVGLIFIIAALFQMSLNLVITYLFFKYRKMDIKRDQGLLPMTVLDDVNSSILLQDLAGVEDQVEPKQGKHFVRVRSRAGTVNEHEELAVSRRSTTG